jgi:cell division inhibitor SulA
MPSAIVPAWRPGGVSRGPAGSLAASVADPRLRGSLQPPQVHGIGCLLPPAGGRPGVAGIPTGHPALDALLPAEGWPRRALTELALQGTSGREWVLLAPCLVALQGAGKLVMLFDPPPGLSGAILSRCGLDPAKLLIVDTAALQEPADAAAIGSRLWAMEQALRSGEVGAVVAWLPAGTQRPSLSRLQRAAESHEGPAFVLHGGGLPPVPASGPVRLLLEAGDLEGVSVQLAPVRRLSNAGRRRRGGTSGRQASGDGGGASGAAVRLSPLPVVPGPWPVVERPAATFVNLG